MRKEIIVPIAVSCVTVLAYLGGYNRGVSRAKTVTQVKEVVRVEFVHRETTTETTTTPKGDTITRTVVVEDTKTDVKTDTSKTQTPAVPADVPRKRLTNISALTALDVPSSLTPVYGISVTREVLGPITVGAFGLTNGTVGVSVGVTF